MNADKVQKAYTMDLKKYISAQLIHQLTPQRVLVVLLSILIGFNLVYHGLLPKKSKPMTHHELALPQAKINPIEPIETSQLSQPKTPTPITPQWITIKTRARDTLGQLLIRQGISQKNIQNLLGDIEHKQILIRLRTDQTIELLAKEGVIEQLKTSINATQTLWVYRQNNHYKSQRLTSATQSHPQYVTATLQGSLYGTARRLNIPYKLIQQMVSIFNWEIDFSRDVRPGDQFSILYNAHYINDKMTGTGEILAVSYTNRGKTYSAVQHKNAYGQLDYFTPQGTSLRKAFSRYPVHFHRISSTFNLARMHPILHYRRPHRGIDLAAPRGTPIRATGDGRVVLIGNQHGYGNVIKIAHQSNYTSIYGHMLKFQTGISRGSFVRRDQVIGYVGQSGLASGPHCHYEFHINHQPQNPTTVPLPHASPIARKDLMAFKSHANKMLASLKLYESSHFAKGRQTSHTG